MIDNVLFGILVILHCGVCAVLGGVVGFLIGAHKQKESIYISLNDSDFEPVVFSDN